MNRDNAFEDWLNQDELQDEIHDGIAALEKDFEKHIYTRSEGNMLVFKFMEPWLKVAYRAGAESTQALLETARRESVIEGLERLHDKLKSGDWVSFGHEVTTRLSELKEQKKT